MADEKQLGLIVVVIAAFFLIDAMGLLETRIMDEGLSTLIAFVLVAYGVYLVSRGK